MKKLFTLLAAILVFGANSAFAADVTVTDADMQAAGTSIHWTSDNVYILDGFVFVGDGQTLTIDAGTVVKGKPGQEENASALIIAKGGKIMANGTSSSPIIFTTEADDLNGSVADQAVGLWGGVIILGKGATNNSTAEKAIEGIPTSETRGLYGAETTVADDNSGSMTYVSIRHGGTNIGEGNEINGLTLGAVGSATTFSYIEIVSNADDGVEWFGGAPKCDHILVAWVGDDSFDYDEGYSGMNQFMVALQASDAGDRLGEHDGGPSSNELGAPYAEPVFSNVTYVGRGASAGKRAVTFRDNAGGHYVNSIFAEQAKGIDIEYREDGTGSSDGQCSYSQWADAGILALENNIFQNVADGTAAGIFKVVAEADDAGNALFTVPGAANTDFAAYFTSAGNLVADAGVDASNPTASGDIRGAVFSGMDAWFTQVDYKGAFGYEENWAAGWSLSLGDVVAKDNNSNAVEDVRIQSTAHVYPNPAIDFVTVEFENNLGLAHTLTLYDISGRVVRSIRQIVDTQVQMDRGELNDGLYIYRLSNEVGVVAEGKIILK
ncbi:MAG: T9SS type A sorting domain-containing protein [Bacteroidales bacterium]